MTRLIRAVVDAGSLRANLARVRTVAPGARVMAVVKANAYGHGLVTTALALADADALAVARLEEAIALREADVRQPIVLLEGVITARQLAEAAHQRLELVVHHAAQLALLAEHGGSHRFALWVKVDTGMNRLGFRPDALADTLERLRTLTPPPLTVRLLTHLARADERECPATSGQVARFEAAVRGRGLETSIGNSAGIFGWPVAHGEWVRPGLALYGASPFAGETGTSLGLVPAMTLESVVIATRRVAPGEGVGYGAAWRAPRESTIAVIAGGYADGLPRSLASGAPVLVGGHRVPLVGRVSMDMLAVDVTGLPGIDVGTAVEFWGRSLAVEEVARHAGTIPYELLCGVSRRVPLELR